MRVYRAPLSLGEPPSFDGGDYRRTFKKEETWIKRVKAWAKKHGKGADRGKEVRFPHADGYACYVIVDSKQLIHLPVGDAWQYPHIEHLPYSVVRKYAV